MSTADPNVPSRSGGAVEADGAPTSRARWGWVVLAGVVGAALAGWALWDPAPRSDPHPSVIPKDGSARRAPYIRGTVEVLVRARVRVLGADEKPVPGARLTAGLVDFMSTDEDLASVHAAIEQRMSMGMRAWKFAMGRTDALGIATLEYTRLDELDDPSFDDGPRGAAEDFPFGASVRIDSATYGTVYRELVGAKNVRYRREPQSPTESRRVAEAEFVIRCDVGGSDPSRLRSSAESDMQDALDAMRKAREAREGK